jgi:IMP dehydrogenase
VLDVVNARNEYYKETGVYVPLCSDGGLSSDTQLIVALAMGADFVMMGRYFAMTSESPNDLITFKGRLYKPYWGEGSNRARNWQRYKDIDSDSKNSKDKKLVFEEGVDAYVPYSGPLSEKVSTTTAKLKAAMCNTGNLTISDFHQNAELTRISPMTLVEGGTSNVEQLDRITSAD